MDQDLLLGADFGSSGVKASVFSPQLQELGRAHAAYATTRSSGNVAEQLPDDLWKALCTVCPAALADAGVSAASVAAIGVSSHYPSLLPLDRFGQPLIPAQTWMDERGQPYCRSLEAMLSSVPRRVNGNPVEGFYPLPKAMWLKEHRPDVLSRTATFAQLHAYLTSRLTGGPVVADRTTASWFHNYDIWNDRWAHDLTAALGLEPSLFPPVRAAWDVVGTVADGAVVECGLRAGTPVVVGTGDAVAAALGAGVGEPGQAYLTTGTGGCVCLVTAEPRFRSGLVTEASVLPGSWLIEGIVKNIGVLLRWFLDHLGETEKEAARAEGLSPYAVLEREARESPPGSGGLLCLPYFSGEQSPVHQPRARGVLLGLTLGSSRGDVIRALMEGVALAVAHNVETMQNGTGTVTELRVTGGPASSNLWAQILADVIGVDIVRPVVTESAPLGDAMLAAVGIGQLPDLSVARQAVEIERRFQPDDRNAKRYRSSYERYKALIERLGPLLVSDGDG